MKEVHCVADAGVREGWPEQGAKSCGAFQNVFGAMLGRIEPRLIDLAEWDQGLWSHEVLVAIFLSWRNDQKEFYDLTLGE